MENKMTKTQEKVLNEIRDSIAYAKKFDNFKDYHIHVQARYCEGKPCYQEILEHYTKQWEKHGEESEKYYKKYWLDKLNNITLTHCSSATLRALEREGYIRIIKDSANDRFGIDYVELLKE